MARGELEPRRERPPVLVAHRAADPLAVSARRVHPALRQRVRGVRDRVQPHVRRREPRADPDRLLLHGQRALEPAPRAGAGARDVRAAEPPRREVVEVTQRRRIAPSAAVWLLLGGAYFLIPLIATFLYSLKSNQTGKCCTSHNYGVILHDGQFWTTIKLSFLLALETIAISFVLFIPTV